VKVQTLAAVLTEWETTRSKPPDVIRTPFPRLNSLLGGGFNPGDLIYVGGRPGFGKTVFMLELARSAGGDGYPTLIISREMVNVALARRLVVQASGLPANIVRATALQGPDDQDRIARALHRLRHMPIWLSEQATAIDDIRAMVAMLKEQANLSYLLVDYLQLVRAPREIKDRRLQVEHVSQGLKQLAVEAKIPVVCLSSLGRPGKDALTRRPTLADLRESGELEHDADTVLLLYRKDMTEQDTECIIAKQRDGALGTVHFEFYGPGLRFAEQRDPL
jgi:replicative DNA helicase